MPPLPTITDVWRVTLNWNTINGVAPRNVFHIHNPGASDSDTRTALNTSLQAGSSPDNMFSALYTSYTCETISMQKLDGTSPSIDYTIDAINGDGGGDQLPSTAIVASFKTAQKGPRGRGRMYIGPVGETTVGGGSIEPTQFTTMTAGWVAFFNTLVINGAELVVASYTHHDQHAVTSVRIDGLVGTQRRRQDQQRS